MNSHTYAVIMAGGVGSRFWPLSRVERPKQFLSILGEEPLLKATVDRLQSELPLERILILTTSLHVQRTRDLLPGLPDENIVAEPVGRNTAACIALAGLLLRERDPESVMVVLPADHYIGDTEEFNCTLRRAVQAARDGHLVTLGMAPDRPETGYGYIQHEAKELEPGIHEVRCFAEKPNIETALRFLKSGDFLWNSGMFIWETSTLIEALETWMPELWDSILELRSRPGDTRFQEELLVVYSDLRSVSIDVGVMEPASRVKGKILVLRATFPWNDVGTWAEIHRMSVRDKNDNSRQGSGLMIDTENCHVQSAERTIVLVGMRDTVVVDTPDALLVCPLERHQDVKQVINRLKEEGYHELL